MSRKSRKLAALFALAVVPAAGMLVWLGVRLLEQDRELWAKRETERRVAVADEIVRKLQTKLKEAGGGPGEQRWIATRDGLLPDAGGRLLWLPAVKLVEASSTEFTDAEVLEYRGGAVEALARYREMARSDRAEKRAGAWMRVARVHRARHEWEAALGAYGELVKIHKVGWNGLPVSLVARRAVCSILQEAGRNDEFAVAVAALKKDLQMGTWALDRVGWDVVNMELEEWTGRTVEVAREDRVFAAAAEWWWADWKRGALQEAEARRRVVELEGTAVTFVEETVGKERHVTVALPKAVQNWVGKMAGVSVASDADLVVAGTAPAAGTEVLKREPAKTGLPWTVTIAIDSAAGLEEFASRRRLLSWGLAAIVLLLAGGSYLMWRAIQRELAVARLQTEFVAAVSHEFRTPLASLRHVTELLEEDDELPRDKRRGFYQALGRNTERLSRLVESLLDFARMEGGRKPYLFERLDAAALAAEIVQDFRAEVDARGFTVKLESPEEPLVVEADREALSHALWNLLDNAVKYSPDGRMVHVEVRAAKDGVAFLVRDEGLGIPKQERAEIFGRFVRGAKAQELGIKGTGLGLAMVSHIVEAHRGKIAVESEEGRGSTFRLVLPAAAHEV